TVSPGAKSANFPITTLPVSSTELGIVAGTCDGISKSAVLKVRPVGVLSVNLTPNPVDGGKKVVGTLFLECEANPGDITVSLTSTNSSVARPKTSSIIIPQGTASVTFEVDTSEVPILSFAFIKAQANGIAKRVKLTVNRSSSGGLQEGSPWSKFHGNILNT